MSEKIIVAIIAAVAAIIVAVISVRAKSQKTETSRRDQFVPSEAHSQSLRLGVIIVSGLPAEARSESGIEQSLGEAKKVATSLARQIRKGSDSFDKENDFNTLNKALERFFALPDLITYRMYYELGQVLGNLKIGGQNSQVSQMILNYIFVNCMSDFPPPFSKLRLSEELQHFVAKLYDIQKRPSLGKKEIDEIAQEAEKVWIIFFGRNV